MDYTDAKYETRIENSEGIQVGDQNTTQIGNYNTVNYFEPKQDDTLFFTPKLDDFCPPAYPEPPFAKKLVSHLLGERLLILGGDLSINKADLARHLAWHVQSNLKLQNDEIEVVQWDGSFDKQKLDVAIEKTQKETIFILPDLRPQYIEQNLVRFNELTRKQHVVIGTTKVTLEQWHQSHQDIQRYWHKLKRTDFSKMYLEKVLRQRLLKEKERLPLSLQKDWQREQNFFDSVSLSELAERLGTPDTIRRFSLFLSDRKQLNREGLDDLLKQTLSAELGLRQWFYELEPRKQLLTIALCFFDGLFDEQFFSALETLVANIWRERDPFLVSFDYNDLDDVRTVFGLVETTSGTYKVESRLENRQVLLEIIWQTHRRVVLASFPYLAQLVRNSVNRRDTSRELYSTRYKRLQLRRAIGESLSEFGRVSQDAVRDTLLALAANNQEGVQIVAAKALARWRDFGLDTELFNVLAMWRDQRESYYEETVSTIIGQQDGRYAASTYIYATIALTVAYASVRDLPNHLDSRLLHIFLELSRNKVPFVRIRFRDYALPAVVENHWQQLGSVLERLVLQEDLIPVIAYSLAQASLKDTEGITKLLVSWEKKCLGMNIQPSNMRFARREALLATSALIYGYLPPSKSGVISSEKVFKELETIIDNDYEHPFVRRAVFEAIGLQAQERFYEVAPFLMNLVNKLPDSEHQQVVDILTRIYLKHRQELEGGDATWILDGQVFNLWLEEPRSETAIETIMFDWLDQANNRTAQEIAFKALLAFAETFDMLEAEEIQNIIESRVRGIVEPIEKPPLLPSVFRSGPRFLSLRARLALFLATIRGGSKLRPVLSGLVGEAIRQDKLQNPNFTFVLDSWLMYQDNHRISIIAKYLLNTLAWSKRYGLILFVVIFAFLFLLYLLFG